MKIIRARDEEYQHVALKEFHLLRSLNHHGIIKMVDAFVNRSRHTIYLVMDLVEGQALKSFVKTFTELHYSEANLIRHKKKRPGLPEYIACSIVKQLGEILKYLHSEEVSVCHRDLNHNNIMITPINKDLTHVKVKLIDFNVSRRFKSKGGNFNEDSDNQAMKRLIMMTQTGAAGFCAPEMTSGQ